MKFRNRLLSAAMTLAMAASAAAEEPIITIRTSIYEQSGESNHFTLLLGATEETRVRVDCGLGEKEYTVKETAFDSEAGSLSGTAVSCTADETGIIRIYGDGDKINYIYGEGAFIEEVDMDACPNMQVIDLPHNNLRTLDLSGFRYLYAVYLSDNPFTSVSPLVVGPDHPYLSILEIDIIDWMDPDFDITTYPALQSFDAFANKSLTHLDPTKCPGLLRISVDSCPITSLDVTQNPDLLVLNIEDSGISEIDVTKCPRLRELYANHMSGSLNTSAKIRDIDLTNCPDLMRLTLGGNELTSIDISNNPYLEFLNLSHNHLTRLDAEANTALYEFYISLNNMGFGTMPLPQDYYGNYVYFQRPIEMDRSYAVGSTVDLGTLVLREGTVTKAELWSYSSDTALSSPLDESYYTYAEGKVTLNKTCNDSVFVRFTNDVFYEYPLTTTRFKVKTAEEFGQPSRIVSFSSAADKGQPILMTVGLDGATPESPREFFIDWGEGVKTPYMSTGDEPTAYTALAAGQTTIYIPEGETLVNFAIEGTTLYSVNLLEATELRTLKLKDTGLYAVDLKKNRCLTSLDLSGNNLFTIDLTGANEEYAKNVLGDIDLSRNRLTSVTLNDARAIHHLNLADNELTAFNLTNYDFLETFSIARNQLEDIHLGYLVSASDIDISGNGINSVILPEDMSQLKNLNVTDNNLTFETLPYVGEGIYYSYAPQRLLEIPAKGPGVDLSAQCRDINGSHTDFTWLKSNGSALTEGIDYTDEGGAFRFIDTTLGEVHCVMTNGAFPDFAGENEFRTSDMEVMGFPTHLVAEFETTVPGETVGLSLAAAEAAGTALYIDWNGDGTGLQQYPLTDTYTLFTAETKAKTMVKAYTYSDKEHITVFSISGASMASMDASRLTDCYCLTVNNAGLSDITLPEGDALRELDLDGNHFTEFDFRSLPKSVYTISMNHNDLTSVDIEDMDNIQLFSAGHNRIESILLGNNPNIWHLGLPGNELIGIDLSGCTGLENLSLSENWLDLIDVDLLPHLKMLHLDRNLFTFATLPPVKETYIQYLYGNQSAMNVECIDGKVDLSEQAEVEGTATVFRWFDGIPEFDENYDLVGDELIEGIDYTIEDGVTTFMRDMHGVMCVMTNAEFPSLWQHTDLLYVTSRVTEIAKDEDAAVYNLHGVKVGTYGNLNTIPAGVYITNGKKVTLK